MVKNAGLKAKCLTFSEEWISLDFDWCETPFVFGFEGDMDLIGGYRVLNGHNYFWYKDYEENYICGFTDEIPKYMTMFHYFLELFRVESYGCEATKPFNKRRLEQLPDTVQTLTISEMMTDKDEIAEVMEHFEIEEELVVMSDIEQFHEKMLSIPHIILGNAQKLNIKDVANLDCISIEITYHEYTDEHINYFLKHWKSTKTRLEVLKLKNYDFDLDKVLEGTDAALFDDLRRNPYFELNGEDIDCTEYMDIVRDCDGRVAAVGLEEPRVGDDHEGEEDWKFLWMYVFPDDEEKENHRV
ncbi:hypothetical protein GCK72_008334 [Caenorhabditis remanei]|uniref:Sdz-33 F-box domain-containing protein n=1 Tax=Caenorhabditis remanei TaxID=31234 RepID=A0A6A5GX95_CAERE|nr:hypothetical protein GCK72_008334 [Caenorhabditis remanei]KAF1760088.1 hypothetical protein GCK72_008334 [Caenorhabditis remanei]